MKVGRKKKKFLFIKNHLRLIIISIISAGPFLIFSQNSTLHNLTIGEKHTFYSDILNEERTVYIHLPAGYDKSRQNYPVLYLLDGEKHFQHVVSSCEFLASNYLMPSMIIIGIVNVDRVRDFTPYKPYDEHFPSAGKAKDFQDFLQRELFPRVKKNYRTQTYRILIGHSFGGLFSLYNLAHQPKMFDAYLAISPSLWWDEERHVDYLAGMLDKKKIRNKRIFLAMGDEGGQMRRPIERMASILNKHNESNIFFTYEFMQEEDHESVVNRAVYRGLTKVFEGWKLKQDFADLLELQQHYAQLSYTWNIQVEPDEKLIDKLAYQWISRSEIDKALALLKYNIELYPASAYGYYRLGEAYSLIRDNVLAKTYYEKAYHLARASNDLQLKFYRYKWERSKE